GFSRQRIAHHAQSERGVGSIHDAFGKRQAVVGNRDGPTAHAEILAPQDVAAPDGAPFHRKEQLHVRHPTRVRSFRKLLIGRDAAGQQPLIELPDSRNGCVRIGQKLERHQAPRLAVTRRARLPTVVACSISSGKNTKPYSSSMARTRFKCCTESQLSMVSGEDSGVTSACKTSEAISRTRLRTCSFMGRFVSL